MANKYFTFKQFTVFQENAAFKVTTDSVLLGAWAGIEEAASLLDIGTGTGVLALMAAQRTSARIVAIEPDRDSYMQAVANITASPWHDRITLLNTTLSGYLAGSDIRFDAIITNPPYFAGSLLNPDAGKARTRHTVTMTHEDLIEATMSLLDHEGMLHIVLPVSEAAGFVSMASSNGLYPARTMSVRPTPGMSPSRVLMSLGRHNESCEETEMVIEIGGRHIYSDEYVSLTKDFYLKF